MDLFRVSYIGELPGYLHVPHDQNRDSDSYNARRMVAKLLPYFHTCRMLVPWTRAVGMALPACDLVGRPG